MLSTLSYGTFKCRVVQTPRLEGSGLTDYPFFSVMHSIRKLLTSPGIVFLWFLIGFTSALLLYLPAPAVPVAAVDLLGQATLPTGFSFQGTELGGLSGITYDPNKKVYYAISDDRSEKAPARFYTLKIDLSKGSLKDGGVVPVGVTTLLDETNQPFAAGSLDPEGIALTDKGTVFISSEGNAEQLLAPFIKEFSLSSGRQVKTLAVAEKFLPVASRKSGIRNNLAFESLTITPDQKNLFTATENALIQDGPSSAPKTSSRCRILQYNLFTSKRLRKSEPKASREFLYLTQPVAATLNLPGIFSSGLVDLVALDNQGHFLSLERSFDGLGNTIQLFEVSLERADDISGIDSLSAVNLNKIQPAQKQLLLDFKELDLPLDNIEGLSLGPDLADGRRSLIVVSDNNFQSAQRTQVLAFAIRAKSAH